jgi:hypothetical protein
MCRKACIMIVSGIGLCALSAVVWTAGTGGENGVLPRLAAVDMAVQVGSCCGVEATGNSSCAKDSEGTPCGERGYDACTSGDVYGTNCTTRNDQDGSGEGSSTIYDRTCTNSFWQWSCMWRSGTCKNNVGTSATCPGDEDYSGGC